MSVHNCSGGPERARARGLALAEDAEDLAQLAHRSPSGFLDVGEQIDGVVRCAIDVPARRRRLDHDRADGVGDDVVQVACDACPLLADTLDGKQFTLSLGSFGPFGEFGELVASSADVVADDERHGEAGRCADHLGKLDQSVAEAHHEEEADDHGDDAGGDRPRPTAGVGTEAVRGDQHRDPARTVDLVPLAHGLQDHGHQHGGNRRPSTQGDRGARGDDEDDRRRVRVAVDDVVVGALLKVDEQGEDRHGDGEGGVDRERVRLRPLPDARVAHASDAIDVIRRRRPPAVALPSVCGLTVGENVCITRFAYQPALDGVRAVAVLLVLVYHAGFGWMSGGYVGVSVFFTLSGFLITTLALVEHDRAGRIDVGAFYSRRVRRLLPASLLCLAGVIIAARLHQFDGITELRRDLWAALAQVYNWVLLANSNGYAEEMAKAAGQRAPLDHYWSLAIEEQFYWVWPLVLIVLLRAGRRRRLALFGAVWGVFVAATMVLAVVSAEPSSISPHRRGCRRSSSAPSSPLRSTSAS